MELYLLCAYFSESSTESAAGRVWGIVTSA